MARLNQIQNWSELGRQVNWSVAALAKKCSVSKDTLRRHFRNQVGESPKDWLTKQRQHRAMELLRSGSSIKETAFSLGYKQQTNFTRSFKQFWGVCPSLHPPPNSVRPLECAQVINNARK